MSEPKTAEVKFEDAIVRDIAEQLGASIAGLGFPVGMGTAPPEEMCRRAARGIVALYGRQLSSAASASPPAETGEGEAVAWRYAHPNTPTDWRVTDHDIVKDWPNLIVQPLYTHPASDQSDTERMRAIADVLSHQHDWRKALTEMRDRAEVSPPDIDDRSYWQRQLDVLDRIVAALAEKAADQ